MTDSIYVRTEDGRNKYDKTFDEANIPTSDQKAALPGTSGTPASGNKYVTNSDSRLLNAMPVGAVIPWGGNAVPSGWLECAGGSLSTTTYSGLFAVTGYLHGGSGSVFSLPDARGVVLRGFDNGRGLDSGRTLASYQADAVLSHTHSMNGYQSAPGSLNHVAATIVFGTLYPLTTGAVSSGAAAENRVKSLALKYIIKY